MKQEFLEEFADFCSSLAQAVIMLLARRQIHKKKITRDSVSSLRMVFVSSSSRLLCTQQSHKYDTMVVPFAPHLAWDLWILPIVRADPLPKGSGGGVVEANYLNR
jgi:hypothetical protein